MTCLAHDLAASRGMLVPKDVDLIQELVQLLPQDKDVLVANFGAGSGTTALAIFEVRKINIKVISVDIDPNLLTYTRQVVEKIGCSHLHDIFAGDTSVQIGDEWAPLRETPIDLLLIDTSHEEVATRRELIEWLPRVRTGGYVWMHDYERSPYEAETFPGVKRAVQDILKEGTLTKYKQSGCGWSGIKV